mmetsp:Transcript_99887/g.287007  ORF Transcript_99887/g.287007 Transcript_99887/m.287007 type:complete len:202 (-) Transcript_99887:3400-4005(-)
MLMIMPKHLPTHAPENNDGTKRPHGTPVPKVKVICTYRSKPAKRRACMSSGPKTSSPSLHKPIMSMPSGAVAQPWKRDRIVTVDMPRAKVEGKLVIAVTKAMTATSKIICMRRRKGVPSRRPAETAMLLCTKRAPSMPPTTPKTKNNGYSANEGMPAKCVSNMVSLPVPVGSHQRRVSAATTAAKKARTIVFCGNIVLTSS